jgi:hypothetical protein
MDGGGPEGPFIAAIVALFTSLSCTTMQVQSDDVK